MIDLHCHLDLYPDPLEVVRECVSRRLYVLSVTTTPSAWPGTSALASGIGRIQTALGLHPQLARERKSEMPLFEEYLPQAKYVGEVGLDGTPECKRHWSDQVDVFAQVLTACQRLGGRVMSVHSRRAAAGVLDLLEAHPGAGTAVLHWFSGSNRELGRAIGLGCWFSVGPGTLWSEKGVSLVRQMPPERVLVESDGPFAIVGGRAALPWDTERVIPALAATWHVPVSQAKAQVVENFAHLVKSAGGGPPSPDVGSRLSDSEFGSLL
jgi:TatD DNase family protein